MPRGLKFQRKHRRIGCLIKYVYYCLRRRDIIEKKATFGELNPDKIIYIVKPDYQDSVEGLLSLVSRQLVYINYAKNRGYETIVDWKNYKTQYYDGENNIWEFYFEQPSNLCLEDAYKSKNVYLSGWTLRDVISKDYFSANVFFNSEFRDECASILKKYLAFNDEIINMVAKEAKSINIKECIGIYIRGTDYVQLKPSGEYVQPNVEQLIPVIKQFQGKYRNAGLFLVTEDGEIFDALSSTFNEQIKIVSFDSFIRGYSGKSVLSKSNVLDENKKRRGQNYLVKMILLSKCKYLISSITQGSKFSYLLNDGNYEDEYIFNLGLYK